MYKKIGTLLSIVVIVVIFCSMYFFYWDLSNKYNKLRLEYDLLEFNYAVLESSYRGLNETHQALITKHDVLESDFQRLSDEYDSLKAKYFSLLDDYDELSAKHLGLFKDYEALLEVFNEPLSCKETPSRKELRDWLLFVDKTNEIKYNSSDFICGDFAVMLSQHAKMKHWDMGVVAILGYYRDTREPYGHAFNAIICVEGLYYVEPQKDRIWHYEGYKEIKPGHFWEIDGEWIYVQYYAIVLAYS